MNAPTTQCQNDNDRLKAEIFYSLNKHIGNMVFAVLGKSQRGILDNLSDLYYLTSNLTQYYLTEEERMHLSMISQYLAANASNAAKLFPHDESFISNLNEKISATFDSISKAKLITPEKTSILDKAANIAQVLNEQQNKNQSQQFNPNKDICSL